MLCDKCNKNTAMVQVKQGLNGIYREYNLCKQCAYYISSEIMPANLYDEYVNPFSFLFDTGMFSNLLDSKYTKKRSDEDLKTNYPCKICGSTLGDILKTGKFGCGNCYTAFYGEVLPGIVKIHANKEYTGRMPNKFKARLSVRRKTEALKNELSAAVERQDYEKAAELRDKINAIKEEGEIVSE